MSRKTLDTQAEDARKLANILLELSSITSKSPGCTGYADDHQKIVKEQIKDLMLFKPLWWQIICSPLVAWQFAVVKRRLASFCEFGVGDYLRVRKLVCRLRFGYVLDPYLVVFLDRHLSSGRLAARDVWRLTHSLGCRVSKGNLEPIHISKATAGIGAFSAACIGVMCVALGFCAVTSWYEESNVNVCQSFGTAVLAYVLAHIAPTLLCLTWGSRDASIFLQELLKEKLDEQPIKPKNTLISRLAW